MGLSQNPDLITLRGTTNVGAAAVEVAGVYPWNPFVQAQYLPNGRPFTPGPPGSASGQSNYYIWVMQRFELAHQRRHRENSAVAALGQMRWNIRQAELINIAQSERMFFTALYQRQLLELAADVQTLSDRLGGVIERRFKAGLATNLQAINVRVAIRQSRRQRSLADAAYQAALLALRQQLGMPTSAPLELSGDLTKYEWFSAAAAACRISDSTPSDPQSLAEGLAEARPDVLASRSAIVMAQANLSLARAARVPDVQAGPIYDTADDGTRFIGLRLQRDIGIWNNGSALANQRLTEVQQQRLAFEQIKRRAANEAAAAIDRYERARRLAGEAAEDASESPPPELQQALSQFEAGNAEIVDIVAVQNNLLQETRSYLDLLNEVAQSATFVTQMAAIPPERLFAQRPPRFSDPVAP
jgi:outer membrane protein TolC